MLKPDLVPTPLAPPGTRKPVPIVDTTQAENWWSTISLLVRWISIYLWMKTIRKEPEADSAKRVRELFEKLGGLWIKVGQLISLRTDLISAALSGELSKLQHRAVGFPFAKVKGAVEREMGGTVEEIFDRFDETPLAAASVSQVHSARLRKEQVEVAVKVQRPDIARKFRRDMTMLRVMVFMLKRMTAFPRSSWDEMLWEMEQIMLEEVDYRYEAANMRRMARALRKHKVYVPEVFPYSGQLVLVMEFVPGVLMSDFIHVGTSEPELLRHWMEENNVTRQKTGERLFISFFRQLFEDNLFHGDLHPGNILLLRDSRLAFIDFGTVGSNNAHFLSIYMRGMQAVGEQDYSKGIDYLFLLCDRLPRVNLEMVKATAVKAYQSWGDRTGLSDLSYHEKSIGNMGASAGKLLAPYNVVMSWQFMKIGRTWSTLDASLSFLLPDVNFPELLRKYFKGFQERAEQRIKSTKIADVFGMVRPAVSEFATLRGDILRHKAVEFHRQGSHIALLFRSMFKAIAMGLLLFGGGWAYLMLHGGGFEELQRILDRLPDHLRRNWILATFVGLYVFSLLRKLVRRFSDLEPGSL
jgi:ubiquinone biosynthesis protein